MKSTIKIRLFAAVAAALGLLASCQRQAVENPSNQEELVPVSLTASFNTVETKVSYTEETATDGIKLQPAWKADDKVIGFDGATPANTYTFTVSKVDADGVATLNGTCPASCNLHLIYLCGASASSISDGSLDVSYDNQAGTGDSNNVYTMPAVMLADGEVSYGSGDFNFSNAGAVIGVKAVKGVPNGSIISKITVSGEDLSAAKIALDGSRKLKLTATTDDDDAISTATLSGVTVTDDDGTLSNLVLIAVPADAKVARVKVAAGDKTYSFTLASAATLAAGKYSYISGDAGQTFTEDIIPVSGITLDPTSKTITPGESFTITATVSPSDATDKTVTWTSSDPTVATVDSDGKVTGVKTGTATITASAGGKSAICTVTVKNPTISLVANPSGSASFKIDGSAATSKEVTSGTTVTIKAEPASGDYVFVKWSDGNTDQERTVTVNEDVEYTAVFSYRITANFIIGHVYGNPSTVEYLDANKAKLTAGSAPAETSFAGWIKEGGDGTVLSTDATYTTDPSSITAATNFIPVFKSDATSKYVDIITALNDDKTVKTHTKWAKQNLAISESGKMKWNGGGTEAVKVPGTDEDVIVGDYFQWAAYAGYCGDETDADKGLLIYKSFTNEGCVDGGSGNVFIMKDPSYCFEPKVSSVPYFNNGFYSKYNEAGETLQKQDDAANIILGGNWRIPTFEDIQALASSCFLTPGQGGLYFFAPHRPGEVGFKYDEHLSNNYYQKSEALLFIPFSGQANVISINFVCSKGEYWSSKTNSEIEAIDIIFMSSWLSTTANVRYFGHTIRPVLD